MSHFPEDRPRILVVDDEKVIRDMLADFLGMEGYVVRTAEDGTSALGELQKGHYDLILTGVQAEDGGAQVGGMLAALLDYPFASLVTSIEVLDGGKLKISREIEGGTKELNEIDLPCVLSIQTGINEPRYVGMRGIRQVASVEIPVLGAPELGVEAGAVGQAAAKVKREDYFVPALGKGAEMLQGGREEIIDKLLELVKAKGGLK